MINKALRVKVGMSFLKVLYRVSKEGRPYLKAYNLLGEAVIGVWVNPKIDLKELFAGKPDNRTYSILGYYRVSKEKDNADKDFIFINYIDKIYEHKTQETQD